jgi:hypothetical protein
LLPKEIQAQAKKTYRRFIDNPSYPSLKFKNVHPKLPIYSVRIGRNYRAVGQLSEETVIWFWVGSHSEYDMLLSQLR